MVSRHREPDCNVLVEPFVHLHEVENALLEVVKHADLHSMDEVRLWEATHDEGNRLKHVESSMNMARQEFGIGCLAVGFGKHSI